MLPVAAHHCVDPLLELGGRVAAVLAERDVVEVVAHSLVEQDERVEANDAPAATPQPPDLAQHCLDQGVEAWRSPALAHLGAGLHSGRECFVCVLCVDLLMLLLLQRIGSRSCDSHQDELNLSPVPL